MCELEGGQPEEIAGRNRHGIVIYADFPNLSGRDVSVNQREQAKKQNRRVSTSDYVGSALNTFCSGHGFWLATRQ